MLCQLSYTLMPEQDMACFVRPLPGAAESRPPGGQQQYTALLRSRGRQRSPRVRRRLRPTLFPSWVDAVRQCSVEYQSYVSLVRHAPFPGLDGTRVAIPASRFLEFNTVLCIVVSLLPR